MKSKLLKGKYEKGMDMDDKVILVGGWVKIIKKSRTRELVGAQPVVVNVIGDYVDVDIDGDVVRFNKDEVIPLTFKERWGLDKLPTMYHGTDLKIFNLSDEDRKKFNKACVKSIAALRDFYRPYLHQKNNEKNEVLTKEQEEQNPGLSNYIYKALSNLRMMNLSEEWEYGDFYLTSSKMLACLYANQAFAGGEIGFTAYFLIRGAELNGVDLSKQLDLNEIDFIKAVAEGEPQPVIFVVDNLSPEYLRTLTGGCIQRNIRDGKIIGENEFRYIRPVTLDPSKAEIIDKDLKKSIQNIHKKKQKK